MKQSVCSCAALLVTLLVSPVFGSPRDGVAPDLSSPALRELLPPELIQLAKVQRLSLVVDTAPRDALFSYDREWAKASLRGPLWEMSPNGEVRIPSPLARGFAFGGAAFLEEEEDVNLRTKKTLWNSVSVYFNQHALQNQFELRWTRKESNSTYSAVAKHNRYYTRTLSEESPGQLFRELFSVTQPAWMAGFGLLTFRAIDASEDYLWLNSAAISKIRQLTGSMRTDGIFGSIISLDDFFGWSGNPNLVEGSGWEQAKMLVPLNLHTSVATSEGECLRFESAGSIAPQSFRLIPRNVIRMELIQKDPFSGYGRQILIVDRDFQIPLYKIAFDQGGRLLKIVVVQVGIGVSKEEDVGVALPWSTSVYDLVEPAEAHMEARSWRSCRALPEGSSLSDLDPSKFKLSTSPTPSASQAKPRNPT